MNVVTRTLARSTLARTAIRAPLRHAPTLPSRFARAYSASTSTSPQVSTVETLLESVKSSKDVQSIHSSFSDLVKAITNTDGLSLVLSSSEDQDRLLSILQLLAKSGRYEDVIRIDEILVNLYPLLQIPASEGVYSTIIQSLVDANHSTEARDFLIRMYRSSEHPTPTIEQFNILLKSCRHADTFAEVILDIKRLGLKPTSQTFQYIFAGQKDIALLAKKAPTIRDLSLLIDACVEQGMVYDPAISGALYDTYASLSRQKDAATILDRYHTACPTFVKDQQDIVSSRKGHSTEESASEVADLGKWGRDAHVDDISLEKSIAEGRTEKALDLFEKAVQAGTLPPTSLFTSLLHLVVASSSPSTYLDRTLTLARSLANARKDSLDDSEISVYHAVIRVFTRSHNISLFTPIINDLIHEMEERGLHTDTQLTAVTRIIIEMRAKGNYEDARPVYRKNRQYLGVYGYSTLLKEYCRISFAGDLQVPLITEFFSIVHDMRLARVPIHTSVYGIFITAIGNTATRIMREGDPTGQVLQRLVESTRRVHDFLTLDASVSPDAALWNQLMDTYQRLECFAEAFRLWEMMYLTGRYDQVSISIILDACGYIQDLRKARSVLTKVAQRGFKIDLRNWNTWIECLCRCGRLDEAADVILVDMGKHGIQADMQSVSVLFKFLNKGASNPQTADIRRRVEAHVPTLWRSLPKEVPNP